MADQITQSERLLKVHTPLPFDTLLIESFSGSEEISRPFHFVLRLRAEVEFGKPAEVIPDKLIGNDMALEIETQNKKGKRFFHGICRSFSKEGSDTKFAYYRAEVQPWFAFLDLTSDCRIFQNKTVPEIIEEVVKELGFAKSFRNDLKRTYTPWDYCVQYRETDFNFLSRLMEEEGIAYYFVHEVGKHTMVLVDKPLGDYDECPVEENFQYRPELGVGELEDTIETWEIRQELLSAKWVLRDHHFEKPTSTLEAQEDSVLASDANRAYEVFDYPGDYAKKFNQPEKRLDKVLPEGETYARIRMEREERGHLVFDGTSHCRTFTTGFRVNLKGKAHLKSGSYLLTMVHHSGLQHPNYASGEELAGDVYSNTFACLKTDTQPPAPYRPARVTPKPTIHGMQTGRVIDEHPTPTEDIWPDKFGRVLVRFPWDRLAKHACWIRVSQPWAGNQWGHQWIPRVGDEVVVAFLEGDPDRPLIVGSVYNANNMPPFALPANKTQSGILTHSSPGGSGKNFNMLRFEDKKGHEEIYLHAEKNLRTRVECDEIRKVDANRTTTIYQNDVETVEKGDHKLTLKEGNREATIDMGNDKLTITMGDRETTISMGNDKLTVSLGNVTHEAPVGKYSVSAMNVEVSGTLGIKLTCGASSIEMLPAMITIQAPLVKIN